MPEEPLELAELPLAALVVRLGQVRAANSSAVRLLDRPADALIGSPIGDLIEEAGRDALTAALAAGQAATVVAHLAGTHRRVELSIAVTADGQLVVVQDRQDLQRAEAVLDAVADSTLLLDPAGRLLWQSNALAARVPGEVNLGTHPVERIHPEDLPIVLEAFASLDQMPGRRTAHVVRSRAVEDDDVWQLIEVVGASRVDDPDLGGVVVQVRNLDEGAQVESLGETQGPLLSLAEAAPVGIVLLDRTKLTVFANRVSRELLALSARGVDRWRERIARSHQAALDRLLESGLEGEQTASTTVPFQTPSGDSGWLRMRVVPHRGPGDAVVGAIVALEEVTAEVEARAESERLLTMLDVTLDFVLIFRPDGEILHTNAALQHVLDRLWAEGGSGRLGDLLGAEARDRFVAGALSVVADSDTWQGELLLNVGGGLQAPVSVLAVVGRDDLGEIDWIAMVARDITALKEAEDRLRHMATLDHLTGLANRALFTDELDAAVDRSRSTGRPVRGAVLRPGPVQGGQRSPRARCRRRRVVHHRRALAGDHPGRRPGRTGGWRRVRGPVRGPGRPGPLGGAGRAGHHLDPAPDRGGRRGGAGGDLDRRGPGPQRGSGRGPAAHRRRSGHVPGQGHRGEPLPHHRGGPGLIGADRCRLRPHQPLGAGRRICVDSLPSAPRASRLGGWPRTR